MKVLHILNELKHSGAEVMLRLAYDRFKGSGIDSHILSPSNEGGDYAAILKQTGYKIHHIAFRRSPAENQSSRGETKNSQHVLT